MAQPLLGSEQSGLFTVDMNKLFRSSDFGKKIISANNKARLELQNENEELESELPSEEKELSEQRKILSLEDFQPKALEFDKKVSIIRTEQNEKEENLKNINKLEKGGLSGKPLEVKSNLLINKFFKILRSKIKIIGVGGVDSGKSAYEKIINGANLVQLYTGMVYQGPNIASKITKELIEITKNHSVKNISELVGIKK